MDDLEQKMKTKLLQGLIEHMGDKMGDGLSAKFPKKPVEIGITEKMDGGAKPHDIGASATNADDDSDEDRLMQLMDGHDDEEEDMHH